MILNLLILRDVFNVFKLIQPLTKHTLSLSKKELKILKMKVYLFLEKAEKDISIKSNERLANILGFVCTILNVKKEDFISLALVNLLEEELDWIKYNDEIQVNIEEVEKYQSSLSLIKSKANLQVLK